MNARRNRMKISSPCSMSKMAPFFLGLIDGKDASWYGISQYVKTKQMRHAHEEERLCQVAIYRAVNVIDECLELINSRCVVERRMCSGRRVRRWNG